MDVNAFTTYNITGLNMAISRISIVHSVVTIS
jgi:hypothetical protein